MLIWILTTLLIFIGFFLFIGLIISVPGYEGPRSDHFNGKKFFNENGKEAKGFKDLLKWLPKRKQGPWYEENAKPDEVKEAFVKGDKLRVTFINHASFLIQTEEINILTDPFFALRASPFHNTGPKRTRPPGISISKLPPVHYILISHNHYDHLDIASLKEIYKDHKPYIIVPLGVSIFLWQHGITKVKELDWWQMLDLDSGLKISAVPAQHFSGRGLFDRNKTLWAGYVIESKNGKVYFAGDTGYNENYFKAIAEKFFPLHVSLLPIGAYKPRWFMQPIHLSPEEAVQVHRLLRTNMSIAMHFGTLPMAEEGKDDAPNDFMAAKKEYSVEQTFLLLDEGEYKDFNNN